MFETDKEVERAILIGVVDYKYPIDKSLDELESLFNTAGGVAVARVVQNRDMAHKVTYFGKGKLEELKETISAYNANCIVCDDELSPLQLKTLENELSVKILDRTMVILDIFAKGANSREAILQVELAQLRYMALRLVGMRDNLSRLGGGIGSKGPGEKQLELDRRILHEKISKIRKELRELEVHREVIRTNKNRKDNFVIAIVGYTNAGKSTLLNSLTDAKVYAADKLFATLDTVTRKVDIDDNNNVLLSDTVGFIRKLPHNLIEAFKSTLVEIKYADLIMHVVDSSCDDADVRMDVVYETLKDLGVSGKEILTVYNKSDINSDCMLVKDYRADYDIKVSAKTGEGLSGLKELIAEIIRKRKIYIDRFFAFNDFGLYSQIRDNADIISEEYNDGGVIIKAYIDKKYEYLLK